MKWIESGHCKSHAHCLACRTDLQYQEAIAKDGWGDVRIDPCPRGYRLDEVPPLPPEPTDAVEAAQIARGNPCCAGN